MNRRRLLIFMVMAALLLFNQTLTLPLLAQEKSSTIKVARLLEESGYPYKKLEAEDHIWVITIEDDISRGSIFVTTEEMVVIVAVIMAKKNDVNLKPKLMEKLLQFNHKFYWAKVGIDEDGIHVRIDLSLRVLDAEELKTSIKQIMAAADELYATIKPFKKKSK